MLRLANRGLLAAAVVAASAHVHASYSPAYAMAKPNTRNSAKANPGLAAAAKAAKQAAPKPQGISKGTKDDLSKEVAKLYARLGKLESMYEQKKPGGEAPITIDDPVAIDTNTLAEQAGASKPKPP